MGCGASAQKKYTADQAEAPAPAAAAPAPTEEEGEHAKASSLDLVVVPEAIQEISGEELAGIFAELHRTPTLAADMFEFVRTQLGKPKGVKLPLLEFLDDLNVDPKDTKAVQLFLDAAIAVRKCVDEGAAVVDEGTAAELAQQDLDICINEILRVLASTGRPTDECWQLYEENLLTISESCKNVLEAYRGLGHKDEFIKLVRERKGNPPLLPCGCGLHPNRERAKAEVAAIAKECRAKGIKFTDPTWDVTKNPNEVLYVDKAGPGYDCTVGKPAGYKRLTEIYKNACIFDAGCSANDIFQGNLGTCFLLGAIGAVAAQPEDGVRKLFLAYDIELGIYAIRFFSDGMWSYVIVDDYMPVNAKGKLLYSKCSGQETWCPLMEKAYCKFHTCYEMCDGGSATTAIFTFWGGGNGKLMVEEEHKADPSKFFKVLDDSSKKGYLLTTTFNKQKESKGLGTCGEAVMDNGLVAGHVYSVLNVVSTQGNMLVCVRNPWGSGEWTGKWSDKNEQKEWTPEMVAATGWTNVNNGMFFMSIQDFVQLVGVVSFACTFGPQWRHITHYGKFRTTASQGTAMWDFKATTATQLALKKGAVVDIIGSQKGWWKGKIAGAPAEGLFPWNYIKLNEQPVARFDLNGSSPYDAPMTVVVQLVQPRPHRKRQFYTRADGKNYKKIDYEPLQLVVVGEDGNLLFKREGATQVLSGEVVLPAEADSGSWKVYCVSVGGCGCAFYLKCFVQGCPDATLKEVPGAKLDEIAKHLAL